MVLQSVIGVGGGGPPKSGREEVVLKGVIGEEVVLQRVVCGRWSSKAWLGGEVVLKGVIGGEVVLQRVVGGREEVLQSVVGVGRWSSKD